MTLTASIDVDRCCYLRPAGQCRRRGNTVVAGVEQLLCRQHARIVATEPGSSGVLRPAPVGLDAIVAEVRAAVTWADIRRCEHAIALQIDVCHDQAHGLRLELRNALAEARARLKGLS